MPSPPVFWDCEQAGAQDLTFPAYEPALVESMKMKISSSRLNLSIRSHLSCTYTFQMSNTFHDNSLLHLHRRLPIQPHVLVSSDLQVPLQHVKQHGELQKKVSALPQIEYSIFQPERRWAPCPPSPWSSAACCPTAGTFLLGKAVILEVPLKLPSLSWLVWSSMTSKRKPLKPESHRRWLPRARCSIHR